MRPLVDGEAERQGRRGRRPLPLALVVATLLIFALAALTGAEAVPGVAAPEGLLADAGEQAPRQPAAAEADPCAAHPAVCNAVLAGAATAAQGSRPRSAVRRSAIIPACGPAPEHNPPPPKPVS